MANPGCGNTALWFWFTSCSCYSYAYVYAINAMILHSPTCRVPCSAAILGTVWWQEQLPWWYLQ
jgi:hypothetical protein